MQQFIVYYCTNSNYFIIFSVWDSTAVGNTSSWSLHDSTTLFCIVWNGGIYYERIQPDAVYTVRKWRCGVAPALCSPWPSVPLVSGFIRSRWFDDHSSSFTPLLQDNNWSFLFLGKSRFLFFKYMCRNQNSWDEFVGASARTLGSWR